LRSESGLFVSIHFELLAVLMGVDGMTILYRRETGTLVADVVVLDAQHRAIDIRVYSDITLPGSPHAR